MAHAVCLPAEDACPYYRSAMLENYSWLEWFAERLAAVTAPSATAVC